MEVQNPPHRMTHKQNPSLEILAIMVALLRDFFKV